MIRQARLFARPEFPHPTARGAAHYVPVLQTLSGELRALRNLAPTCWERVTPLIEVSARSGETDEPSRTSPVPNLPRELARIFGDRPFFLDFPWLSPTKKLAVREGTSRRDIPAMEYVLEQCDRLGLNFVPVIGLGIDKRRAKLVREATGEKQGVCVRLSVSRAFESAALPDELDVLLSQVGAEPPSADMVIDLRYIDPDPGYDTADLQRFLDRLPRLWEWRSLIIVGTVIPETLSRFDEESVTALQRHEWRLWNELRRLDSPRSPTFGDYAIQHPKRPSRGGWRMRANIRYSTPDTVLIARGRSLREYGAEEYRRLCEALVQHPQFRSYDYSWGDAQIVRCAQGLDGPGSQVKWRGAGTSHHLQVMVEALAAFEQRPRTDSARRSAPVPDLAPVGASV